MNSTTGNRKGWRLPSIHELQSLVHPAQTNPALPLGHPFLNAQSTFWSATTNAETPTHAWIVLLFANGFVNSNDKNLSNQVWCVRGGMQADQY